MITGLLLAGGRSRRMGQDKALLPVPGAQEETFIEHLLRLLAPFCQELLLVTRDVSQAADYAKYMLPSVRTVTDKLPDTGPLMGLYSGLSAMTTSHAFVTAVDTPFLQPELLAFLLSQPLTDRPVIPVVEERPQVLTAIYPRSILPVIEQRLLEGRRDPRSLLDHCAVQFVTMAQLRTYDPQLRSFLNLNTPEELADQQEKRAGKG
ncbi:molybdenum cofactor guanylyltransferase [Tengunoibacter tsumagoiensis]|uniref:Probable molybdenum cofactor guanylyltransferase n=1 Tax=Tengunoibacter tsumagoiensis TaxID=2014871 RepID=A0A402A3W6_9CHLR|nr:molybdenum cofactor guanylyltransferase [Tengunoibacter tsumagoiensis]GCE13840.1 putative molybdenum cofactor guanylyltransferase [Tengunoibacter tsumagoiensis]